MKRLFVLACALSLGLTMTARGDVFINEGFTYSDGDLTTVSGGNWAAHSGAGSGPIQVLGGQAIVKHEGAEDVNRFTGGPSLTSGNTWYYAVEFSLNDVRASTATPLLTDYFVNLKDSGTVNLRGRLFFTAGTTSTTFKLAVSSSSSSIAPTNVWASDLEFDTTYRAVVSYTASEHDPRAERPINPINPFDGQGNEPNPDIEPLSGMDGWASLWVDPSNIDDTSLTDMNPDPNVGNDTRTAMDSIALRQGNLGTPSGTQPNVEVNVNAIALGDEFNGVYEAVGGTIDEGQPGDFDGDGDVDGRDFLAFQRGESPMPFSSTDLAIFQAAYGDGPLSALNAVPEPTSLAILALALVPLACGRKR